MHEFTAGIYAKIRNNNKQNKYWMEIKFIGSLPKYSIDIRILSAFIHTLIQLVGELP